LEGGGEKGSFILRKEERREDLFHQNWGQKGFLLPFFTGKNLQGKVWGPRGKIKGWLWFGNPRFREKQGFGFNWGLVYFS